MKTLACIKRVPDTGTKINLTDDQQRIDASNIGYTLAPYEECAIEEAVQKAESTGGSATVLSVGVPEAEEQLRKGIAMNADQAELVDKGEEEWRSRSTASAIADAALDSSGNIKYDMLFFGNESADLGDYQVGIRVANQLDIPFVAGATSVDLEGETAIIKRDITGGNEVYEVSLPVAVSVKEGVNNPRYPSMRDRMQARNHQIDVSDATQSDGHGSLTKLKLESTTGDDSSAEVLGEGVDAVPEIIDVLENEIEVI